MDRLHGWFQYFKTTFSVVQLVEIDYINKWIFHCWILNSQMKYLSFWHCKLMFSHGKEASYICGNAAILYCLSPCKHSWLEKLHQVGFFILLFLFTLGKLDPPANAFAVGNCGWSSSFCLARSPGSRRDWIVPVCSQILCELCSFRWVPFHRSATPGVLVDGRNNCWSYI